MGDTRERFPLFPLGLVLLPQEAVPLHIFEQRYRTMVDECLEFDTEFGIIWLGDGGLREVGCCAQVESVIEQFDDGRMNILVRGLEPFRLLNRIEDLPYPAGDIELLDDEDEEVDEDVATAAREHYAKLVERATDERPTAGALKQLDAYGMVANVEVPLDAKQELLEQRSERQRLEQVGTLFADALERIDRAERVAQRARGNGRVHG